MRKPNKHSVKRHPARVNQIGPLTLFEEFMDWVHWEQNRRGGYAPPLKPEWVEFFGLAESCMETIRVAYWTASAEGIDKEIAGE